ncbi:MAG: hypothetical protein E6109_01365 [Ruminococcus sp.]|nr:hypothetical protein [Ruminococcus sp.]
MWTVITNTYSSGGIFISDFVASPERLIIGALLGFAVLLFLIIKVKVQPFIAIMSSALIIGLVVGMPVFFESGLLILIPVAFGIARKTGKSVFCYSIPLLAGLAIVDIRRK